MYPFAQSMIVSALTASEGNHVTSIVHCDAVPTGYLGMDIDPDTLLYIQVVRPYDPAAGRYLTAGSMAAGTYNIYAFANNTPVDRSVRDVRGAGMQGIVGGSPIGAGISALVDGVVDGVVDSIWSTINSFKDGAIAAGEHIRDSWYELSDDNWDAFHSRQSDFFRSWVSHSTFQQLLEPLWLNPPIMVRKRAGCLQNLFRNIE
jgi:RHS repeat-associated protein